MFRLLILSLLCLLPLSGMAQKSDCQKFRVGTFQNIHDSQPVLKIIRNEKYQYEIGMQDKVRLKMKVEWVDECTYKLIIIKGNKHWKASDPMLIDRPLFVRIIETGKDYYIQSSTIEGVKDFAYVSRVVKVK